MRRAESYFWTWKLLSFLFDLEMNVYQWLSMANLWHWPRPVPILRVIPGTLVRRWLINIWLDDILVILRRLFMSRAKMLRHDRFQTNKWHDVFVLWNPRTSADVLFKRTRLSSVCYFCIRARRPPFSNCGAQIDGPSTSVSVR